MDFFGRVTTMRKVARPQHDRHDARRVGPAAGTILEEETEEDAADDGGARDAGDASNGEDVAQRMRNPKATLTWKAGSPGGSTGASAPGGKSRGTMMFGRSGSPNSGAEDPIDALRKKMAEQREDLKGKGARYQRASMKANREEVEDMVIGFTRKLKAMEGSKWVMLPENAHLQNWGLVMLIALSYTALVTPYEVGVLGQWKSNFYYLQPLYISNSVINLIFAFDIVVCFFTSFVHKAAPGVCDDPMEGKVVREWWSIAKHYVYGGFTFDLFVTIPWDEIFEATQNGGGSNDAMKFVRVLRLVRLARLFKFKFKNKYQEKLEAYYAIPIAYYSLVGLFAKVCIVAHFLACLWVLVGSESCMMEISEREPCYDGEAPPYACKTCEGTSWFDGLQGTLGRRNVGQITNVEKYSAAIYWAMYTLTSVGYGDISASNTMEMQVCTICLLIGSFMWAYIIGSACSILTSISLEKAEHQQTMDHLNNFLKAKNMPLDFRIELRQFFTQRNILQVSRREQDLVKAMSPALKGRAVSRRSAWLFNVPYLADANILLIAKIEAELCGQIYPPLEQVEWQDALTTVSQGLAARCGKIYRKGCFWGEDFILTSPNLKVRRPANTLTYVELLTLNRLAFFALLVDFPEQTTVVRKVTRRYLLWGGVRFIARLVREGDHASLKKLILPTEAEARAADAERAALRSSTYGRTHGRPERRGGSLAKPPTRPLAAGAATPFKRVAEEEPDDEKERDAEDGTDDDDDDADNEAPLPRRRSFEDPRFDAPRGGAVLDPLVPPKY